MARWSLGRRRIVMRRMTNQRNLLVTFSKRRAGLLKKASELCTLCGGELAIIVFSPGKKKVFSFGHPSLELVIDKFIRPENPNPTAHSGLIQPPAPRLAELNQHLSELHDHLETQTAFGEALANERRQGQALDWFQAPVQDLGLEQLQMLKAGLTELKALVANRRNHLALMQQVQNPTSLSLERGEQADGPGAALGIIMTPQGYALCKRPTWVFPQYFY